MIVPTSTNFKHKFGEFSNLDDASIELALEEAVVACGNGEWTTDADQTLALYYYAAHLLQLSIMRAQSATGQVVQSERVGELSVTYATPKMPAAADSAIDLNLTSYGIRFLGLVRANFPAILTVNSAVQM